MSTLLLSWSLALWSAPPGCSSSLAGSHSVPGAGPGAAAGSRAASGAGAGVISGPVSGAMPLDLKPLREPLDRAAAALERAVRRLETVPDELRGGVHLGSVVLAVLVTVLLMTVIHQHGLAASKENRRS